MGGSIYYRKGAFRDVSGRFGKTPRSPKALIFMELRRFRGWEEKADIVFRDRPDRPLWHLSDATNLDLARTSGID